MTFAEFITAVDQGVRAVLGGPIREQIKLESAGDQATWTAGAYGARIELVGQQRRILRFVTFTPEGAADGLGNEPLDDLAVHGFVQRVAAVLARAEDD